MANLQGESFHAAYLVAGNWLSTTCRPHQRQFAGLSLNAYDPAPAGRAGRAHMSIHKYGLVGRFLTNGFD